MFGVAVGMFDAYIKYAISRMPSIFIYHRHNGSFRWWNLSYVIHLDGYADIEKSWWICRGRIVSHGIICAVARHFCQQFNTISCLNRALKMILWHQRTCSYIKLVRKCIQNASGTSNVRVTHPRSEWISKTIEKGSWGCRSKIILAV